nr:hypothetical protein [Tanacetum cinerariifolium]
MRQTVFVTDPLETIYTDGIPTEMSVAIDLLCCSEWGINNNMAAFLTGKDNVYTLVQNVFDLAAISSFFISFMLVLCMQSGLQVKGKNELLH